jgi:hypothetical protein
MGRHFPIVEAQDVVRIDAICRIQRPGRIRRGGEKGIRLPRIVSVFNGHRDAVWGEERRNLLGGM